MTSLDDSEVSSDENSSNEEDGRNAQISWINLPRLSLIELAYKLKQTEMKMINGNSKVSDFFTDFKKKKEDQDLGEKETDNNQFFFGIEQTAKDALMAVEKNYKDQDLKNANVPDEHLSEQSTNNKVCKKFGCGWCDYVTDSKSHLMRHSKALHKDLEVNVLLEPYGKNESRSSSNQTKKHQCGMCKYQTDCRSHMKRHQASVHIKNKSYHCRICHEEFSRSEQAKDHHFEKHSEKHFDIRNMQKITSVLNEDSDQIKRKLFTDNDMINLCVNHNDQPSTDNEDFPSMKLPPEDSTNTSFTLLRKSDSLLVDEVQSSEGDNNFSPFPCNKSGLIRCLKCNEMCKDLWQLRTHVGEAHPCSREHFCKVCPYSTNQQQRLLTHMLKHKEIFCGLCDFSTTNNFSFQLHAQSCNSKRVFTCSLCNITFNSFLLYKQHMTSLHNEHTTMQCSDCQFTCTTGKELNQHLQLHLWKACPVCSFHAPNQQGLISHISEAHSTCIEGLWVCSVCHHSEKTADLLSEHFNNHVPGFFHCEVGDCTFKALLESSLELHLKYMHSNDTSIVPESMLADVNFPKLPTITPKQSHTRKSDYSILSTTSKKLKVASQALNNLHSVTHSDSNYKKQQPSHKISHQNSIPSFLFADEDVIVVTPTSPSPKKDDQMFCPRCPERPPFVYKKSFQKHLSQHAMEDRFSKC